LDLLVKQEDKISYQKLDTPGRMASTSTEPMFKKVNLWPRKTVPYWQRSEIIKSKKNNNHIYIFTS